MRQEDAEAVKAAIKAEEGRATGGPHQAALEKHRKAQAKKQEDIQKARQIVFDDAVDKAREHFRKQGRLKGRNLTRKVRRKAQMIYRKAVKRGDLAEAYRRVTMGAE